MLDTADLADPAARWATLRAKELPTPFGDMNISLYLLCRRIAEHVPVVLSGETVDSLFTGLSWEKDTEESGAPLLPWNALARRYGARFALGCGLLDARLLEKIDLTGYSRARMREALDETPLPAGLPEVDRRVCRERYLHLTRFAETQIGRSERTATAAGSSQPAEPQLLPLVPLAWAPRVRSLALWAASAVADAASSRLPARCASHEDPARSVCGTAGKAIEHRSCPPHHSGDWSPCRAVEACGDRHQRPRAAWHPHDELMRATALPPVPADGRAAGVHRS